MAGVLEEMVDVGDITYMLVRYGVLKYRHISDMQIQRSDLVPPGK